ncbi:hypothetical protein PM082_024021 [Marasmius tenuissimus]|nr:hypothetical protein PM082_024021 [Marasmius tenuissimus]
MTREGASQPAAVPISKSCWTTFTRAAVRISSLVDGAKDTGVWAVEFPNDRETLSHTSEVMFNVPPEHSMNKGVKRKPGGRTETL